MFGRISIHLHTLFEIQYGLWKLKGINAFLHFRHQVQFAKFKNTNTVYVNAPPQTQHLQQQQQLQQQLGPARFLLFTEEGVALLR